MNVLPTALVGAWITTLFTEVLVGWLCLLWGVAGTEQCDWACYVVAIPSLILGASMGTSLSGFYGRIASVSAEVGWKGLLCASLVCIVLLRAWDWTGSLFFGYWRVVLVLPAAIVLVLPFYFFFCRLRNELGIVSAFLACFIVERFGLFWQLPFGSSYLVVGIAFWMASREMDRVDKRKIASPLHGNWLWYLVLSCCIAVLPLVIASRPILAHHWGYYVGPIQSLKAGFRALWDVPSQYGFLSVLIPALCPVRSAWTSLYLVYAGLLIAQALMVFRITRQVLDDATWWRSRHVSVLASAVVAWTSTVAWPGEPGANVGVWSLPSTGAYRFFWVFATAYFLTPGNVSRSTRRFCVPLIACMGALWASESAAYVLCTLAFVGVADAYLLTVRRQWHAEAVRWGWDHVVPVAGIAICFGTLWALGSDLTSFYEYSRAYSTGFGAIPMKGISSVLLLVWLASLAAAYGVTQARASTSYSAAGVFAPFAACAATATYFVSRSVESNARNLLGLWVPLLLLCWQNARSSPQYLAGAPVFRSVLVPLLVGMVAVGVVPGKWVNAQYRLPAAVEEGVYSGVLSAEVNSELDLHVRDAPLLPLLPILSTSELNYRIWLPAVPWDEFSILSPARQREYVRRWHLDQRLAPCGYILFRESIPPVLLEFLKFYERQSQVIMGDLVLEHYCVVSRNSPK